MSTYILLSVLFSTIASVEHEKVADGENNNFSRFLIDGLSLTKADPLQQASLIPAFHVVMPDHNNWEQSVEIVSSFVNNLRWFAMPNL